MRAAEQRNRDKYRNQTTTMTTKTDNEVLYIEEEDDKIQGEKLRDRIRERFDIDDIGKYKLVPLPQYFENGEYVGAHNIALDELDDPEEYWPNFG